MTTIRVATVDDAAGIARVQVDTWRTTYRGIIPDERLASMSYERSAQFWARELGNPDHYGFVALDGSQQVVGFVSGGRLRDDIPGYDGEVYAIYVLAGHQRGGSGRALMQALAKHMHRAGFKALLLWVLKDNPIGRGFYERMGGVYVAEKPITLGKELIEVAYGWPDIRALAAHEQTL